MLCKVNSLLELYSRATLNLQSEVKEMAHRVSKPKIISLLRKKVQILKKKRQNKNRRGGGGGGGEKQEEERNDQTYKYLKDKFNLELHNIIIKEGFL